MATTKDNAPKKNTRERFRISVFCPNFGSLESADETTTVTNQQMKEAAVSQTEAVRIGTLGPADTLEEPIRTMCKHFCRTIIFEVMSAMLANASNGKNAYNNAVESGLGPPARQPSESLTNTVRPGAVP